MPQTKIAPGVYMIQGRATKDAEFKIAGQKNTHIASFSLAVGKNKDTTTIYANCKAFNRLADYAQFILKGDSVLCIGTIQEREYEGKTYKDFICEWLNFVGLRHTAGERSAQPELPPVSSITTSEEEEEVNEEDLPF